jgi:hypothetical protein
MLIDNELVGDLCQLYRSVSAQSLEIPTEKRFKVAGVAVGILMS